MKTFERLRTWQNARKIVAEVYKLTSSFPAEERFCLTQQIRRAILSVISNIAEGSGRLSGKDQAHFYSMAYSSLLEVDCQLIIAIDLNYMDERNYQSIQEKLEFLARQISQLRKSTQNTPLTTTPLSPKL